MVSAETHQAASLIEAFVAYKLITGREPNTPDELHALMTRQVSLAQLRDALFAAPEFAYATQHYAPNHKPLDGKLGDIQVHVSTELMEQMIQRTEQIFRNLGETEPHWSVLTNEKFRSNNIEKHKHEFFETGKHNVRILQSFADRAGIDLGQFETCFELGCGVGRITTWLSEIFPAIIACDISKPLLDLTRKSLAEFKRHNVKLMLLKSFAQMDDIPPIDMFFTAITLQHNPPPICYLLLSRLLEKLRPGGIALFQLPTFATDYRFNAVEYLSSSPVGTGIEIHVLPQPVIFQLLQQHDCHTLEMREDGSCGPTLDIVSNTFFVRKSSARPSK